MKLYLVVTIDVEPDCSPSWHYSDPLTFEGVRIGIKERLQPLFNKYGIVPTYLINNVVLEDVESVNILKNLEGNYELGTHLHPEFIEPEKSVNNYAGSKGEANCCFYKPEIEFEKIKNITELFENKMGYKPTSFRAGRFSANKNTIASLVKCGYKVDTSVTPHISWDDKTREEPIDHTNAYEQPYFIKEDSFLEKEMNGPILEVPVTICPFPNNMIREYLLSLGGLRRKIRKTKYLWLRPVKSSLSQFIEIVNYHNQNNNQEDDIILNMMFHNVEVLPGISPYTKNEYDCTQYLNLLDNFFKYCKFQSIKSINLSRIYDIYKK